MQFRAVRRRHDPHAYLLLPLALCLLACSEIHIPLLFLAVAGFKQAAMAMAGHAWHEREGKWDQTTTEDQICREETRWRLAWPYDWLTARAAGATARTWARCRRAGAACLSVALPWCLVPTLMRDGMMDGSMDGACTFLNPVFWESGRVDFDPKQAGQFIGNLTQIFWSLQM